MIKECLQQLIDSKLDLGDNRKKMIKKYIDTYEEEQLYYIMQQPLGLIAEDINIYYLPNTGFRCSNNPIVGRLPMCNIFTKILNEKYKNIIKP